MSNGYFDFPCPTNEPIRNFEKGSSDKKKLKAALARAKKTEVDIPMYIGSEEIRTGNKESIHPPHEIKHKLGVFHRGEKKHITQAISSCLKAKNKWAAMPWEQRASIFLKAADLIAGKYRYDMLAATMLGQSKNAYQAEIDSTCEFIDFLRFNVHFLSNIYKQQPISSEGVYNRVQYRPLEGFVLAVTPFNFTAIGGNLPTSAAMCGNVVVWKPSETQIYSANLTMKILKEAGLPDGVINMIYCDGPEVGEVCFSHKDFAGVHFTGSTGVFQTMWKSIGENIHKFRSYPRIVGETGGKDFVMVHPSSQPVQVATALLRGSFEFQGQKCSAASRAYLPKSLAKEILTKLKADMASLKMGTTEDFRNFINAVIDERSFDKIASYIDGIKKEKGTKITAGGGYDKSKGYFVEPTLIETKNPNATTMCEEIFGPVLTVYVYDDKDFSKTLKLVDTTSPYALTGSIFATDRYAVKEALEKLENSAGNFYINDKPTGAVVGQQPFGGGRASGTNDKAGSMINLYRWLSPRTIKETFNAPNEYGYPFLEEK
jgi:1-pyrroline-5-carboxylate dehydrogenase